MNATLPECSVTILVKALPQLSAKHGETVCCAGVTPQGDLKRLFPVRFRHLSGDKSFKRWDRVEFKYRRPTSDRRTESCHVWEDSIAIVGQMARKERAAFLEPLLSDSVSAAQAAGKSLALIRPRNTEFHFKSKSLIQNSSRS